MADPNTGRPTNRSADDVQRTLAPEGAAAFLLIDCSSSMFGNKIAQAREGVLAFAREAIGQNYAVGLIGFASDAEVLCPLDRGCVKLAERVKKLQASGTTNMADAIRLAVNELEAVSGVRAIIIATDGMPDEPRLALEAARAAHSAGIDLIAIGTDDADRDFLKNIASRSSLSFKVPRLELREGITKAAKLLPAPQVRK